MKIGEVGGIESVGRHVSLSPACKSLRAVSDGKVGTHIFQRGKIGVKDVCTTDAPGPLVLTDAFLFKRGRLSEEGDRENRSEKKEKGIKTSEHHLRAL